MYGEYRGQILVIEVNCWMALAATKPVFLMRNMAKEVMYL